MVIRIAQHDVLEIELEDLVAQEYGEPSNRQRRASSSFNNHNNHGSSMWGTIRQFGTRNIKIVTMLFLVIVVAAFMLSLGSNIETTTFVETTKEGTNKKKDNNVATHGNSYGGKHNIVSPGGAKAASDGEDVAAYADIIIPKSNVGHATPSLSEANIRNLIGHYIHDEFRSPYSSPLYDQTKEFLDQQQEKFLAKMKRVREEWGAWNFHDPSPDVHRPEAGFDGVPYNDLPKEDFVPESWQTDKDYVTEFIKEAKALVKRMQHGIYAEYGRPIRSDMTEEELEKHAEDWKIHVAENPNYTSYKKGIAVFSTNAMDGLVRKLLHAMMTHDEFYAVLAGHSAAAGHGNDFQQNRIITFHRIMEPVFDKLGMRLISRNMGMGGVGTLQFSLAGGDLYGEADILEWDSGMTEKGPPVDLFNKQAILSGERVPVIISSQHHNIKKETDGMAYMGRYLEDKSMIPQTTLENAKDIPYAARWMNEKQEKYNAVCWEPRTDFQPRKKQNSSPGSQVSWHPGNRVHTWQGRKLALIVLHALAIALETWESAIKEKGCPLDDSYWHVGKEYEAIRDKLRKYVSTPKSDDSSQDVRSPCETMIPWLPRVCRVQMHGFGMWTPRVLSDFDFLQLIHPAPNGYKPDYPAKNIYEGFDLLPLKQALPDGEVDVHAIAIATTDEAPDLDHSWKDDDGGDDEDDDGGETTKPPTRRWLREQSERALRWGPKVEAEKRKARQDALIAEHHERMLLRELTEDDIVPGRGWEVHGWDPLLQFCDGSAQSECARSPHNACLLYGANDKHMDVSGTPLSGWLVFTVPNVQEGIILIRMEWWCSMDDAPRMSDRWKEVNDGKTTDTTPWNETGKRQLVLDSLPTDDSWPPEQRHLKKTFEQVVPTDLEMDFAINGTIKTMEYKEWRKYSAEKSKNVAVWPLLNDVEMAERDWDGAPVEVAVRFRSEMKPHVPYCISHVYYA
eukprot:scaffold8211_cov117-Cylindrotheca_fusiformis.AAC.13